MDQIENTIFISRPISPSPIMVATIDQIAIEAVSAPVEEDTVEETMLVETKTSRRKKYVPRRKSIKPSELPEESSRKRSLEEKKSDLSKSLGGRDFMVHMFTIENGEDIIERIKSFARNSSRGISILSANGAVCNVEIQPFGSDNRVLTFKDAYGIVSLSGTVLVNERGEVTNETGRWQISIGGVDGYTYGGSLAGSLIAASPVQVFLGSFCPLVENPSLERNNESGSAIVTPPIPNAMDSASTGQVQEPEMRDPCPFINLDF